MTGTGIFDDLLDARVLRGRGPLSTVDVAFSLLTRGRTLSPLGRALRAGSTAAAETVVREVWRAEFGEDATQPSLAAGPRRPALLIRTMACVAQREALLDANALDHLDATLPQLDLPADARARLAALLADPGAPADIVRDVETPGEALLVHVVARSVRAPGAGTPHPLHAALEARQPLANGLLRRLDDAWVRSPDHAAPRPRERLGSPPGLPGAA